MRLVWIAFVLIFSSFVIAMQNPGLVYCELQGHDSIVANNSVYCLFPDGSLCDWRDFRNETCGEEHFNELDCVGKDGFIHTELQDCCYGLKPYFAQKDCEGCLPVCKEVSKPGFFLKFWGWVRGVF
jgi:putative hemolysin